MANKIIYTKTDEAPFLATHSLLPILEAFTSSTGIEIELRDISLAGRILAVFPESLTEEQKVSDALSELGELTQDPAANIIKLPNISASVPQLKAVIEELQGKNYNIPDYPEEPETDEEKAIKQRYDKVKGSAVNPVLREGNSDRRAPKPVKAFARIHPHRMGKWSSESKSHVATMSKGDFRSNEKSITLTSPTKVNIQHKDNDGNITIYKEGLNLLKGEILDSTYMSKSQLLSFLSEQIQDSNQKDILFSLHMKATMMKVSDPIIFGHAVRIFFAPLFDKWNSVFEGLGVDVNNGFGDLLEKIEELPENQRKEIERDIQDCYDNNPDLAMVNSDKGITNLHVPSDVIIDASMPAMIRTSGQMWDKNGNPKDAKAVIPDSSYASIYQETIDFCKEHGAFDPATMGSIPNVGLMAKKAEEYGSHDKTFEIQNAGKVQVVDSSGNVLLSHNVEKGDIWRACQTKDDAVENWVELAVSRSRSSKTPIVFWLDINRAHDAEIIKKVEIYLKDHDTNGLEIHIMSPKEATRFSLSRIKDGKDTISVTGNVLRDYNTDLFPILEVGTSAKMLSIVPLMKGGGLFETGAGGSAPKHIQQFLEEGHLRWDSLGEFLALAVSLDHLGTKFNNPKAVVLGESLDKATEEYLQENRSPSRKVNELDNRGSHFYLAMYWAQALAEQDKDLSLKTKFTHVAKQLEENKDRILQDFIDVQGVPVNINGYYAPDSDLVFEAMRPSKTFNNILSNI
jgi:isocitrate dehydrogenase